MLDRPLSEDPLRATHSAAAMAVHDASDREVQVFSTCPSSLGADRCTYLQHVRDVARWSEENGCHGILVYTDNSVVDPWLVSQVILQNTSRLCPLVAVQPLYMHPYTVAKMISSLAFFYGRRIYLNMVAGGFKNDLNALNDPTPHDRRYDRIVEYTTIIRQLLETEGPVSYAGEFYRINQLKMTPPLPKALFPGLLISGSSDAGMAAARAIGAIAVKYPKPAADYCIEPLDRDLAYGVRVGVIARADPAEAWAIAHERFPVDRKGQIARQLAMKVSDSTWHHQLEEMKDSDDGHNPYWLVPFENYKTNCPYLVGDYDVVACEIGGYLASGHRTFILDIPQTEDELRHVGIVFKRAVEQRRPC
jgi:alkanesulfonate monooxygenase